MEDDVIKHQPDICFIEYSTGDMSWKSLDVGPIIEAMVRKLEAINCQVCFLYLYRNDRAFDLDNPTLAEYEKIARFHGIPSINVGKYVEELITAKKVVFEDLYRDHVHNTFEGGEFVADYIGNAIKSILTAPSSDRPTLSDSQGGERLFPDTYVEGQIIEIDQSMIFDPTNYQTGEFMHPHGRVYQYYQIDTSNELRFAIEGRLTAITAIVGRESGIVEVITPKRSWEFNFWDPYCHYDRFNAKLINLNFDKLTPIRIKLTDKPIDYSVCRRKMENTDTIVKNLRVIALLVCGRIVEWL